MIRPAPSPQAVKAAEAFDLPGGRAQAAQIEPKPEDVDLEAGEAAPGLFDDLPEATAEDRALNVLRACAPGRA